MPSQSGTESPRARGPMDLRNKLRSLKRSTSVSRLIPMWTPPPSETEPVTIRDIRDPLSRPAPCREALREPALLSDDVGRRWRAEAPTSPTAGSGRPLTPHRRVVSPTHGAEVSQRLPHMSPMRVRDSAPVPAVVMPGLGSRGSASTQLINNLRRISGSNSCDGPWGRLRSTSVSRTVTHSENLPVSHNVNGGERLVQHQLELLHSEMDEKTHRWEAAIAGVGAKVSKLSALLNCDDLMTSSRRAEDDVEKMQIEVRSELEALRRQVDVVQRKQREEFREQLGAELQRANMEAEQRYKSDICQLEAIKSFFGEELPQIKLQVKKGKEERNGALKRFEEIVTQQSEIWLSVLETCQRQCEETKREVDSKLEAFVDAVIEKLRD